MPLINPIVDLLQQLLPPDEAVAWASQMNSSVLSLSVMETMDMLMQTGFPVSLHILLLVASTKDGKAVGLNKEVDAMSLSPEEETPDISVSTEKIPVVLIAPTPLWPPQPCPSTSVSTAPPATAPAPPKKSWASLLHPSTSSSFTSA